MSANQNTPLFVLSNQDDIEYKDDPAINEPCGGRMHSTREGSAEEAGEGGAESAGGGGMPY